uniref:Uncharacterized protein n=1 Tax=Micrurus spixii TaxID=129469 RepID=A0A2D4M1C9_9SAUR
MKAATDKWKLMAGWPGDGGTDGEAAVSQTGLHLARTGMDETTPNEKLPAGPYTKAKHTQKGGVFKSTILLQFISNATIYSTPKMVISIINTESRLFKTPKSLTLCVFSFLKRGGLNGPLEIGFSRKDTPKTPRKLT